MWNVTSHKIRKNSEHKQRRFPVTHINRATVQIILNIKSQAYFRACLHGGGGPQVGESKMGRVPPPIM